MFTLTPRFQAFFVLQDEFHWCELGHVHQPYQFRSSNSFLGEIHVAPVRALFLATSVASGFKPTALCQLSHLTTVGSPPSHLRSDCPVPAGVCSPIPPPVIVIHSECNRHARRAHRWHVCGLARGDCCDCCGKTNGPDLHLRVRQLRANAFTAQNLRLEWYRRRYLGAPL